MLSIKTLTALSFTLLTLAAASPIAKRQSATTCGNNDYSTNQVSDAANAAINYVQSDSEAGGSKYPEHYNDYEGFTFGGVQGPYYEFPIEESGVYDGGSPGADRVVVTEDGEYAGAITHTGASGDNFVGCSGTS